MISLFARIAAILATILASLSFSPSTSPTPTPTTPLVEVSPTETPLSTLKPTPDLEVLGNQIHELQNIIASYTPEPTPTPIIIYQTPLPTPEVISTPMPTPTPNPNKLSSPIDVSGYSTITITVNGQQTSASLLYSNDQQNWNLESKFGEDSRFPHPGNIDSQFDYTFNIKARYYKVDSWGGGPSFEYQLSN